MVLDGPALFQLIGPETGSVRVGESRRRPRCRRHFAPVGPANGWSGDVCDIFPAIVVTKVRRMPMPTRTYTAISRFWRDRAVFEALRDLVLPELGPAVSAWSAGCASGEEPYSLVLAASEACVEIHVVATDVDHVLLERARRACYPESSLRDLPANLRARSFEYGCLRLEYREPVEFLQRDVRDGAPRGPSTSRSAET
jgi:hypothetical protein